MTRRHPIGRLRKGRLTLRPIPKSRHRSRKDDNACWPFIQALPEDDQVACACVRRAFVTVKSLAVLGISLGASIHIADRSLARLIRAGGEMKPC